MEEVLESAENRVPIIEENEPSVNTSKNEVLEDKALAPDSMKGSQNDSEYESIDSADNSSEHEDGDNEAAHDADKEANDQSDSESNSSVVLEREEGDGQESTPSKKVDDDEDKKNPQYIPKRGTFYEHDDRTLEEESKEVVEKPDKQTKKNVWMEKKERWGHDRYNDNEQAPKSRSELVAIYGYDIRNEDGPPRARRRRRYGRGPNKYTRNWEDEDAYKPLKPVRINPKSPRSKDEEFPALSNQDNEEEDAQDNNDDYQSDNETPISSSKNQGEASVIEYENSGNLSRNKQDDSIKSTSYGTQSDRYNNRPLQHRVGTGRIVKPKPDVKKEIRDSDCRGFTKSRQYRNSKSEQTILPKGHKREEREVIESQNYSNRSSQHNNVHEVERSLNKLNLQDGKSKSINKQNNQRQNSVPPRLQAEQKGSKRYSSLRQRSLPETAAPPFTQQAPYYAGDYNQPSQSPPQQQGMLQQAAPIHAPTPQVPQIPPPPLPPIPQQVPVTATPILQAPPQFAPPFPPAPPPFLQPSVAPPPFIPPPPQIINYVQNQPQFPQPPYHLQHQQFPPVNQQAELYQCQGGTTYYSTQSQQITQRPVPLKRPKAAIPILPPPPQEPRGRGRTSNQRETPSPGDDTGHFIDNNNYEDLAIQQ